MLVRGHPTVTTTPGPSCLGWVSMPVVKGSDIQYHQVPVNDTRAHQLAETCACGVTEDLAVDGCFTHNAWDHREAYERGTRKAH